MLFSKKSANPHCVTLDKLLEAVWAAALEADAFIWLECGTLLGAIRNDDYIPWEDDLDFGGDIFKLKEDVLENLRQRLEKRGFKVQCHDSYIHISVGNSDVHADINLYDMSDPRDATVRLQGPGDSSIARLFYMLIFLSDGRELTMRQTSKRLNKAIYSILRKLFGLMPERARASVRVPLQTIYNRYLLQDVSWHVPREYLLSFERREFRGVLVNVPSQSKDYLAYRYGKDWYVPRQAYDTWKEDATIVGVGKSEGKPRL